MQRIRVVRQACECAPCHCPVRSRGYIQRQMTIDDAVDAARRAVIAAVIAVLDARDFGNLEDRRLRRTLDPTWSAMQRAVVAYTLALRDRDQAIDEVIGDVKSAVLEGAPELPPHNAIRAATV